MSGPWPVQGPRGGVRRALVVGGGAAGLAAAVHLASSGVPVRLVCDVDPRRASSVRRTEGLSAPVDDRGRQALLEATLRLGGGLVAPAAAAALGEGAAAELGWLTALGVPWLRSPAGELERDLVPGCGQRLGCSAADATTQQVIFRLEAQLRRLARAPLTDALGRSVPAERLVVIDAGWRACDLVLDDDGTVVGVVARQLATGKLVGLRGDGVCLATGGYAGLIASRLPAITAVEPPCLIGPFEPAITQAPKQHVLPDPHHGQIDQPVAVDVERVGARDPGQIGCHARPWPARHRLE